MKIKTRVLTNKSGLLVLETWGRPEVEEGKYYNVDIKAVKSVRSLKQNRLMWAIINRIASDSGSANMDVYVSGLRYANVSSDIVYCRQDEAIKGQYRAISFLTFATLEDGTVLKCYEVWKGSSKYDSAEMTKLIEFFIQLANENNISVGDLIDE